MELYYIASVLTSILGWFHCGRTIEQQIIELPLVSLQWIVPKFCPPRQILPPLTQSLLRVWDWIVRRGCVSSVPGPLTPIMSNPEFLPGLSSDRFLRWTLPTPSLITQALSSKGLQALNTIMTTERNYVGQ